GRPLGAEHVEEDERDRERVEREAPGPHEAGPERDEGRREGRGRDRDEDERVAERLHEVASARRFTSSRTSSSKGTSVGTSACGISRRFASASRRAVNARN